MNDFGSVKINGERYRIDINTYMEKDLADFSPRGSVPGGAVAQSELLLYQPLNQTDWRHGFGFPWHTDSMGYMFSAGNIDTRHPGVTHLYPDLYSIADTSTEYKHGFVAANDKIWSYGEAGLRYYTGGVWTSKYATAEVRCALYTEDYLFFSPINQRIQKMTIPGEVVSDAGYSSDSENYAHMIIYNGNVYASIYDSNEIYYASEDDLSDLEGPGTADPSMITVGAGAYPIINLATYGGKLYAFRKDGLWEIGSDNVARRILDFSNELSDDNFASITTYNGYMYFTVRSKIYQWNGARITDVTPPRMDDTYPFSVIKKFETLETINNFMYATAKWWDVNTLAYTYSLFCFDGVGWHKLSDFYNGTYSYSVLSLKALPDNHSFALDDILVLHAYSTDYGMSNITSICNASELVASPMFYSASTGNYLMTSRLDMGFRRVEKSITSILVEGSNLSTDKVINVSYSADGSTSFIDWGTVNANGITELPIPGTDDSFECKYVNVKFELVGSTGLYGTPVLEGYTLRFLMRPDTFYGYNFDVFVENDLEHGETMDDRSPAQMITDLKTARDSKAPIEFIDLFENTTYGYISSITTQAKENHLDLSEDATPNISGIVNINIVEAR